MKLAVTRKIEQLTNLKSKAQERRIELVALPLIRIKNISFAWPTDLSLNDLNWLVFSSANGVISFFDRMSELGFSLSEETQIAVIGQKTADTLRQVCRREADFIPDDSYGEVMFKELVNSNKLTGKTLVFPRAELINYDPEKFFGESDINYIPIISYRSVLQKVEQGIIKQLGTEDHILFTSPSNVRSFHNQFGKPKSKLIAIGDSTKESMAALGWSDIIIMEKKNIDTVLELI